MWNLLEALKEGAEPFGFTKDWHAGTSKLWPRAHPNVEGHRVIAEYIIKNLQRAQYLGDNAKPPPLPPPIFPEAAVKLAAPITVLDFQVELQPAGAGSSVATVGLAGGGDAPATGGAAATPRWPQLRQASGWVQVDEGRAKRGNGPTKFGLVSSTETCARASECILAMELEAGPGEQLQVSHRWCCH
jgi:hypothetical protein